MTKFKKSGLEAIFGKGLKEAISDIENFQKKHQNNAMKIPINKIAKNPFQPRKIFDENEITKLAHSISKNGLIQPIVVIKQGQEYILVAGERRLRACKINMNKDILAVVAKLNQNQLQNIALIENVQRENLNPIEEAQALDSIIKNQNITQEQLGEEISKSRAYVSNLIRLLKLPKIIQEHISTGLITLGHGKVLLGIGNPQHAITLAQHIIDHKLSVREVEDLIKKAKNIKGNSRITPNNEYDYVEELLREKLDTRIHVSKNSINISFRSTKDLNRILNILKIID